jgi:hypothetical protein
MIFWLTLLILSGEPGMGLKGFTMPFGVSMQEAISKILTRCLKTNIYTLPAKLIEIKLGGMAGGLC